MLLILETFQHKYPSSNLSYPWGNVHEDSPKMYYEVKTTPTHSSTQSAPTPHSSTLPDAALLTVSQRLHYTVLLRRIPQ